MYGNTSYGSNSRTTTTDVGPVPQGVNLGGIYDLFRRMVAARSAAAQPSRPTPLLAASAVRSRPGGSGGTMTPATERPYDPLAAMRREAEAQQLNNPYGPTPSQFGHPSMSPQGVTGTYINPADVPVGLQGRIPTGFYADTPLSNYTYSPLVDPRRYGQPAGGEG